MRIEKDDKGRWVIATSDNWDTEIALATPETTESDRGHGQAWILSFGSCWCVHVLAYGHLEDALESAAEWLATHAPGAFSEPDYADAAKDLGIVWPTDDEDDQQRVAEHAETDHTYTESGWILSWEWYVREASKEELQAAQNLATYLGTVDELKDAIRGKFSTEARADIAAELSGAWGKMQA